MCGSFFNHFFGMFWYYAVQWTADTQNGGTTFEEWVNWRWKKGTQYIQALYEAYTLFYFKIIL